MKKFIGILGLCATVILFISIVLVVLQFLQPPQFIRVGIVDNIAADADENIVDGTMADMREYRNSEYHFSLRYPASWHYSLTGTTTLEFFREANNLVGEIESQKTFDLQIIKDPASPILTNSGISNLIRRGYFDRTFWMVFMQKIKNNSGGAYENTFGVTSVGTVHIVMTPFREDIARTVRDQELELSGLEAMKFIPHPDGHETGSWMGYYSTEFDVSLKYPTTWNVVDCLHGGPNSDVIAIILAPFPATCEVEKSISINRIEILPSDWSPSDEKCPPEQLLGEFCGQLYQGEEWVGQWVQTPPTEHLGPEDEILPGRPISRKSSFYIKTSTGKQFVFSFDQIFKRDSYAIKKANEELLEMMAIIGTVKTMY